MSGTRVLNKNRSYLVAALLLVALFPGCSQSIKDVVISEESETEITRRLSTELTVEEARLLHAYLVRTYPELEEGRLPKGRKLSEMIADQRALEGPAAEKAAREGSEAADQNPSAGAETGNGAQGTGAGENVDTAARAGSVQGDRPATKSLVEPPSPPSPPPPVTATLPSGTKLQARLRAPISSKSNHTGDRFEAVLDHDLVVGDDLLAPAGSRVGGTLTAVKKSGKVKGRARMSLTFNEIRVADTTYELHTNTLTFEASGSQKKDVTRIGIASGIGAVVGAIAGGGKGAAIGTAIGAGAGTAVAVATPGKSVEFEVEQLFEVVLEQGVKMKILHD